MRNFVLRVWYGRKCKDWYFNDPVDAFLKMESLIIDKYSKFEYRKNKNRKFELIDTADHKRNYLFVVDFRTVKAKEYSILPDIVASVCQKEILYCQNSDLVNELYIYKPILEATLKYNRIIDEIDPADEKKYLKYIKKTYDIGHNSSLKGVKFYYYRLEQLANKIKKKYKPIPQYPKPVETVAS